MSEFKVGDRVRIKKESSYYGRDENNPANEVGVVTKTSQYYHYHIRVIWDNKCTNTYRESDLELVQEKDMTYKLETELTFKEVDELRLLLDRTKGFWSLWEELDDIVERTTARKVVKVGEKEYYEDELSKALSNINAIGE